MKAVLQMMCGGSAIAGVALILIGILQIKNIMLFNIALGFYMFCVGIIVLFITT